MLDSPRLLNSTKKKMIRFEVLHFSPLELAYTTKHWSFHSNRADGTKHEKIIKIGFMIQINIFNN